MHTTAAINSQVTLNLSSSVSEDHALKAPMRSEDFWVRYSNLLMAVWSNPAVKAQLSVAPAEVLAAFELPVPQNARVEIQTAVDMESASFANQFEEWTRSATGPGPRTYTLYIPNKQPGEVTHLDYNDPEMMRAGDACCCCCPCCSCF